MRYMPRVQRASGGEGGELSDQRRQLAALLPVAGDLPHRPVRAQPRVLGNAPPLGGFDRLNAAETLPVWLQRAGYHTTHIGKFLNGYENSAVGVPPGWSEWHGSKRTLRLLRLPAARGRPARHLRLHQRESRQSRAAGAVLDRRLHRQGGRADSDPCAERPALLPLRRLPRSPQRRPEPGAAEPEPLQRDREAGRPPHRRLRLRAAAAAAELQRGRRRRQAGRHRLAPTAHRAADRQRDPQLPLPGRVAAWRSTRGSSGS